MSDPKSAEFRSILNSWKGRLFLFTKLPLAFIAGVKLGTLDDTSCTTSIRFKWINKNPFSSLYFAAMHMAAELSTGLLLFERYSIDKDFAMLVVRTEAEYYKKATGNLHFVCKQAKEVADVLKTLDDTCTILLKSVATDEEGEKVAEFSYHWSLKKRPRR